MFIMKEEIVEKIRNTIFDRVIIYIDNTEIHVVGSVNQSNQSTELYRTDNLESIALEALCKDYNMRIKYKAISLEGSSVEDIDTLYDFFLLNDEVFYEEVIRDQ